MNLIDWVQSEAIPTLLNLGDSVLSNFDTLPLPLLVFLFFALLFRLRTKALRTHVLPLHSPTSFPFDTKQPDPHDLSPTRPSSAFTAFPFPSYTIPRSFSAPTLFTEKERGRGREKKEVGGVMPLTKVKGGRRGGKAASGVGANGKDLRRSSLGELGKMGVPETIEE